MALVGDKIKQEENRKLLENPRVKAMLNTIAYAEGADYNTRVGGGTFSDFSKKPGKSTYIKSIGQNSTAEGRYQFLNKTWDAVAKDLGLTDFSPQSQDIAAIELIKRRGALNDVLNGNLDGAVGKLNKEWASLPTKSGKSAYGGQRARSMDSLRNVFESGGADSTYTSSSSSENKYETPLYTGDFVNYGATTYGNIPTGVESEVKEDTKEEAEAKQNIDRVTAEQEAIKSFFEQNSTTQQEQQVQQPQVQQEASPDLLEQYAQVSQFVDSPVSQEGGIPVSKQGVYDYPMQEVIVPTTDGKITMKGVSYPILGIDEYGNSQMMFPNGEYQFGGKTIHEIPQIKNFFNKR